MGVHYSINSLVAFVSNSAVELVLSYHHPSVVKKEIVHMKSRDSCLLGSFFLPCLFSMLYDC